MIQDFHILHRRKPHTFNTAEIPVWSTCLRSLAFGKLNDEPQSEDECYTNQNAYRFLLEVICGLHSPILGETEVFGQFKLFSQEWIKADTSRAPLVQRLLNDAKAIRNAHLSHLGTQSYGSWVRKNLTSKRVHILGAGHLVREILPYLLKQKRDVVLHVRDVAKVDFFRGGEIQAIGEGKFDHGAVIVAAPMSAARIQHWLGAHEPNQVCDLRDNSSVDSLEVKAPTHVLRDIFEQIEKTRILLAPKLAKVRTEIDQRSLRADEHSLLRPQGWDDLCA